MKAKHINPKQKRLLIGATIAVLAAALFALVIPMITSNAHAKGVDGAYIENLEGGYNDQSSEQADEGDIEGADKADETTPVNIIGENVTVKLTDPTQPLYVISPGENVPHEEQSPYTVPFLSYCPDYQQVALVNASVSGESTKRLKGSGTNGQYVYFDFRQLVGGNYKIYTPDKFTVTQADPEGNVQELTIDNGSGPGPAPAADAIVNLNGGSINAAAETYLVSQGWNIVDGKWHRQFDTDTTFRDAMSDWNSNRFQITAPAGKKFSHWSPTADSRTLPSGGQEFTAQYVVVVQPATAKVNLAGGSLDDAGVAYLRNHNWAQSNNLWINPNFTTNTTYKVAMEDWTHVTVNAPEGKKFKNWNPIPDETHRLPSGSGGIIFTATYEPINVTVTVNLGDGNLEAGENILNAANWNLNAEGLWENSQCSYGETYENVLRVWEDPGVVVKNDAGNRAGWNPKADSTPLKSEITFTATYPIKVTVDIKGAQLTDAQIAILKNDGWKVTEENALKFSKDVPPTTTWKEVMASWKDIKPVKEGYEFIGWNPEPDETPVTEPMIFTAQFKQLEPPTPVDPSDSSSSSDASSGAQSGTAASTGTQTGDSIASVVAIAVCAMTAAICGYVLINRRRVIGKHVK